jgi:hypothetical protein
MSGGGGMAGLAAEEGRKVGGEPLFVAGTPPSHAKEDAVKAVVGVPSGNGKV